MGKMGREAGVGGLRGPCGRLSGRKTGKFAFFKEQFSALELISANPEQNRSVSAPTNHQHYPSLTGDENGKVVSKTKRYHSSMKKGQGYERRWLQSHSLCRGITDTSSLWKYSTPFHGEIIPSY